jgi:hypothetical protein
VLLAAGFDVDHLSEACYVFENHLTDLVEVFDDLKVGVEGGRAARLVDGVVVVAQEGMLKSRIDRDSRCGIKGKHLI